ncbi:NAD-dependent epimerase/dehydratase family protein [Alteromonas sp. CYL-A6]|uniref:NAD-dependent epimerase/dehydratase family protein n=1 Tax=Alteromonas nitratireducens TaxID=3390813 RepID=UPI0034BA7D54
MIRVTGANGFIGQAVLRYCLQHQLDVIGYSRSAPLLSNIVQCEDYASIPRDGCLIHLAETRTLGALTEQEARHQSRVSHALAKAGFSHCVYASSAAVYAPSAKPIVSAEAPFASHLYARNKLDNEQIFAHAGGTVARISNVYGPGMAMNNAVSAVLSQCRARAIEVFNLSAVRDYIWVEDVAEILVTMALTQNTGIHHVSTGVGTSVSELVSLATQFAGNHDFTVTERAPQPFSCVVLDSAQTQKCYNWQPAVAIADGIERLVRIQPCAEK